jgi:hypothetical protein
VIFPFRQLSLVPIHAAAAISCVAVVSCQRSQSENVLASVFQVDGNAVLYHAKTKFVLSPSSRPAAEDKIDTGENGTAAISLIPGFFIQAEPRTIFAIEELKLRKDGNETADPIKMRSAMVMLEQGKIRGFLPRRINGRCRLRIATRSGTLEAKRDTVFSLQWNGEFGRIICVHGKVVWRAKPEGSGIIVQGGNYFDTGSGSKIATKLARISDNGEVEEEMEASIGTAGLLEELETRARNSPAPWRAH